MFTVKHISPAHGESLHSATGVRYVPERVDPSPDVKSDPAAVWVRAVDTSVEFPITDGIVYVMNDAGATVAKYYLECAVHDVPAAA